MEQEQQNWRDAIQNIIEHLSSKLITGVEFEDILKSILQHSDCPLSGLRFLVECPNPEVKFELGVTGNGKDDTHTYLIKDNRNTECRIQYWARGIRPPGLNELLERLFDVYWKPELRTESAGLIDIKRSTRAKELVEETVTYCLDRREHCSLLFCDLDNFGQVNKIVSQEAGNRIIKLFGAALERVCSRDTIFLHDGGDEFLLLLPNSSSEQAIDLSYNIQQAIDACPFESDIRERFPIPDTTEFPQLSTSIGIATTEEDNSKNMFADLQSRANDALKDYAKKPDKGKARFVPGTPLKVPNIDQLNPMDLSLCLIKSASLLNKPFANVWLNYLSQYVARSVSQEGIKNLQSIVERFFERNKLDRSNPFSGKCAIDRGTGLDFSPDISTLDCAFATAHGLLHAVVTKKIEPPDYELSVKSDLEYLHAGLFGSNGSILWASETPEAVFHYPIGHFWQSDPAISSIGSEKSARALLISIGHQPIQIPEILFDEIITVDDRPTSGGGLPDFWEATIARLASNINSNKNIDVLYVIGDYANGEQTVNRLREIETWNAKDEQLAYKTGLSAREIRNAAELLQNHIEFPASESELVKHLAQILRPVRHILPLTSQPQQHRRFLRRDADTSDLRLGILDGCRVTTIAEAYPVVLDIVRQGNTDELILDQAGQKLRELVDFKVHLTQPQTELIPRFYTEDKKRLDEYFDKQFILENGLFSQHLLPQLDAVVLHLKQAIEAPAPYSTRRAILIIPNIIFGNSDIQPLGLVSIRIYPRFIPGKVRLNYSFTWRTVEALVGFPYSLYGSVRYSIYLTGAIRNRLSIGHKKQVEVGEVSYIAHSLHFFMDDYGQNIARKIVDEASV
jgi:diguanylate cyclase (GGDEF)-like protein